MVPGPAVVLTGLLGAELASLVYGSCSAAYRWNRNRYVALSVCPKQKHFSSSPAVSSSLKSSTHPVEGYRFFQVRWHTPLL